MVKSRDGGWQKLLDGHIHSRHAFHRPRAVCQTPGGVVVVWSMLKKNETVVIGYKLAPDDDEIVGQEYEGRPSISF